MEIQHVAARLFVETPDNLDGELLIHTFHDWIRDKALDGILVDVADYRHVEQGPRVLLVGHESDWGLEDADGRLALYHVRKDRAEGSNGDLYARTLAGLVKAAKLLETEARFEGALKFARSELEVIYNDRALVPNSAESFEALAPELEGYLKMLLGQDGLKLRSNSHDLRRRLSIKVTTSTPFDLDAVARNL